MGKPTRTTRHSISNQDPLTETRRTDHIRVCFGHYDRDGANMMSEQYAQGNLQEYEKMWNRWVTEMGLHDINTSPSHPEMGKKQGQLQLPDDLERWRRRRIIHVRGRQWVSRTACPIPSTAATILRQAPPHTRFGHVWEGTCGGFNGTDSSGAWWECTANWMLLQFINVYPQATNVVYNGPLYPCHGRDYYDTWTIWEAALNDSRYGAAWVNSMWTNYTADQQAQRVYPRPHGQAGRLGFRRQDRRHERPLGRHGQEDGHVGLLETALACAGRLARRRQRLGLRPFLPDPAHPDARSTAAGTDLPESTLRWSMAST